MYYTITLQKAAYLTIILVGAGWLLSVGASIILPVIFAVLFALFLYPLDRFIYKKVKIRSLSIALSYLTVLLPFFAVLTLLSMQLMRIVDSLPAIGSNLEVGFEKAILQINKFLPIGQLDVGAFGLEQLSKILTGPVSLVKDGLVSSTGLMVAIAITAIYTFLLLYYRKSFKNFIIYQFEKENRADIQDTLREVKQTVQGYVGGLGLVVILLSVLNSLGLWAIGIQYPVFWGALAGLLAVIPYAGTLLGGLLPFVYALATADHNWQPVAVFFYYLIIQQIEGNLITPKIVGNKVDINPLVAIFALLFFGAFWGVAGVILALPLISIVRIILSHFESTRPVAILMSSDIAEDAEVFKQIAKRKAKA